MSKFFSNIKNVFVEAAMYSSQSKVRQQLLTMSDRQLEDYGFSKQLLLEGTSAWPWRLDSVADAVSTGNHADAAGLKAAPKVSRVKPESNRKIIKKAVKELSGYSDRELAELGINRQGIEEAVRYGRPAVEGAFNNNKTAA